MGRLLYRGFVDTSHSSLVRNARSRLVEGGKMIGPKHHPTELYKEESNIGETRRVQYRLVND